MGAPFTKVPTTAAQALKDLIAACEMMREGASFFGAKRLHQVTPTAWSSWAMQIREAKKCIDTPCLHCGADGKIRTQFEERKIERNIADGYEPTKGLKNGHCNRSGCQAPLAGQPQSSMVDHETATNARLFYCERCTDAFDRSDRRYAGGVLRCTREPAL